VAEAHPRRQWIKYSNMDPVAERQQSQESKPLQPSKVTIYGETSLSNKIWCLQLRLWWWLVLAFQTLLFVLSIGCLGSPSWMEQTGLNLEGGLMRCADCPAHWQDSSYDEIADLICEDGNLSHSLCSMVRHLRDGGAVYVFFELLALVGLFFWMFKVMLLLLERQCFPKLRWLPYTFPVLSVIAHLIALAAWFGVTEASFTDSCDDVNSETPSLCATNAPALSVFLMLLYFLVTVLFIIPHCKYRNLYSTLEGKEEPKAPAAQLDAPAQPKRFG